MVVVTCKGKLDVAITSTKANAMRSGSRQRVSAQVGGPGAGQSKRSTYSWQEVPPRRSTMRCSSEERVGLWVNGLQVCRFAGRGLWVIGVSCLWCCIVPCRVGSCRVVSILVSGRLQTDSDGMV